MSLSFTPLPSDISWEPKGILIVKIGAFPARIAERVASILDRLVVSSPVRERDNGLLPRDER